MFQRYAIYYTPPSGPFEEFTSSWLGWSSLHASGRTQIDIPGFDITSVTQKAQKYGFHATLKAPFRIADGCTQSDLETAVRDLAETLTPVPILAPSLSDKNGFLALRPGEDTEALSAFAGEVTRQLDRFRASLNAVEIKRRNPSALSQSQRENLERWGYPYVMEEFAFHMTLSGPLSSDVADVLIAELETKMRHLIPDPLVLDAVTLLGEDLAGMFHQIKRYPLS